MHDVSEGPHKDRSVQRPVICLFLQPSIQAMWNTVTPPLFITQLCVCSNTTNYKLSQQVRREKWPEEDENLTKQ